MDIEKIAHDLAILYMQLEIKEGQITVPFEQDYSWFVNEYRHLRSQIQDELQNP